MKRARDLIPVHITTTVVEPGETGPVALLHFHSDDGSHLQFEMAARTLMRLREQIDAHLEKHPPLARGGQG